MVISPSVDSMKLTASPNNTLTSLDSAILLVDAVVDAVGLEVSCVASSVGVGGRSSSAACKKAKLMILSLPDGEDELAVSSMGPVGVVPKVLLRFLCHVQKSEP